MTSRRKQPTKHFFTSGDSVAALGVRHELLVNSLLAVVAHMVVARFWLAWRARA